VALREVAGHQLPALLADQQWAAHVEHQRQRPQPALDGPVCERRRDQQPDCERSAAGEAGRRSTQARIVAAGDEKQRDVRGAHHSIRACEQQAGVAEHRGNAEGGDQQARHGGEDRDPDDALLGIHDAGEP